MKSFAFALCCALCVVTIYAQTTSVTVTDPITGAKIIGTRSGGVDTFNSIRYATAGRWQAPKLQNLVPGSTTDASPFPPACAQATAATSFVIGVETGAPAVYSEDCFFGTLYLPSVRSSSKPIGVTTWLYGGGYANGASTIYPFANMSLTRNQAVWVPNYRVGVFGFMPVHVEGLDLPQNLGLQDQHIADEWIQQYASVFGASTKKQYILGGQSAGAGAAFLHTIYGGVRDSLPYTGLELISSYLGSDLPTSRQLARGQVYSDLVQLGIALVPSAPVPKPGKVAVTLSVYTSLLAIPWATLVVTPLSNAGTGGATPWNFLPRVDGVTIPKQPRLLVSQHPAASSLAVLGENVGLEGITFVQPILTAGTTNVISEAAALAEVTSRLQFNTDEELASTLNCVGFRNPTDVPYDSRCPSGKIARDICCDSHVLFSIACSRRQSGCELVQPYGLCGWCTCNYE